MAPSAFLYEVDGHVDRNGVHPRVEAGLSSEAVNGAIGFCEDFLKQIVGVFVVGSHVVNESVKSGAITNNQFVECLRVPGLCAGDQFVVVVVPELRPFEKSPYNYQKMRVVASD